MQINAVIIDDEQIAREVLQNYLKKYCPQVTVLGEAQNIKEAVPLIEKTHPQLVFLDVEMPYGNAFDVLEATAHHQFETIFITAFSEYSIQALNRSASYYILKPIDIQELILAVNKVQETILQKESINRNEILLQNIKLKPEKQQLIIPTLSGFEVVKIDQILHLEADGNFTQIYLNDGTKKMVCRFLKHFEDLLSHPFVRVHRSHIVNIDYIVAYQKGNGGVITLNNKKEIDVSPNYKEVFLKYF